MSDSIFWFRRDLRLVDNAGLYHALKNSKSVKPIFIFDTNILDKLNANDARVAFIHDILAHLKSNLSDRGSDMEVYYGDPMSIWQEIIANQTFETVYTNRDYEPYAKDRDTRIADMLKANGKTWHTYKDHVIFESNEVLKDDGKPYTVFTPYKKKWLKALNAEEYNQSFYLSSYQTVKYLNNLKKYQANDIISLEQMGFDRSSIGIPSIQVAQRIIKEYDEKRDFPALDATSKLGIHFRFGTVSIREKARKASVLNDTYLSELIWRDFYSQILDHFPKVVTRSFREKYDRIRWRNNQTEFKLWCEGRTGYPIVDAGMRQLNQTGYMHNRVRMIVASFLTKHLLIDWRWGEAYFAEKLLDYDLASNSGGWQWASGSGTDAAPYFRVFNPHLQLKKFDPDMVYVRRYVPEFDTPSYPNYIVDHKMARQRCLDTYKAALG